MGCDEIQGFLMAKPMPPDVATKYLNQHNPDDIRTAA
jgi:EAL domain-containing protein (putative c-di-GMP-specific phosphodiesterase class I)